MGPPPLCRGDCPDLPPGGKVSRPKAVTDEGASVCSVLGGHTGPPLQAGTGRTFCRGGPVWPPAGRWGRFPLSGGNVERSETKGVGTIGPYGWCGPCRARRPGAPNLPLQGKVARPKAVTDEVFPITRPVGSSLLPHQSRFARQLPQGEAFCRGSPPSAGQEKGKWPADHSTEPGNFGIIHIQKSGLRARKTGGGGERGGGKNHKDHLHGIPDRLCTDGGERLSLSRK